VVGWRINVRKTNKRTKNPAAEVRYAVKKIRERRRDQGE
jgi:hypothetical protein